MARGRPIGKLCHAECRPKVCVVCFGPAKNPLSAANENYLSSLPDFSEIDFKASNTPSGLCDSCRLKISKGKSLQIAHRDFSFVIVLAPYSKLPCDCRICAIARAPRFKLKTGSRGSIGRPLKDKTEQFVSVCKLCGTPKAEAGKKGAHKCNFSVQAKNAIESLTSNPRVEEEVAQSVASEIVKRVRPSPNGSIRLRQSKGGRKLPLTKGSAKSPTPKPAVTHKELMEVARKYGEREAKKQASFINKKFGRGSVEPHFQKMLRDSSRLFSEDMTCSQLTFREGKKGRETDVLRWCIHVKDLSQFTLKVFGIRKLNYSDTTCKLSIDKGGNLLKFSLSIIDEAEDPERVEHKSTGVCKIFVVACVVGVDESHHNFQVILDLIQAYKVAFIFSGDFKAVNYLSGVMSNSAKFPCFTCEVEDIDLDTSVGPIRTIAKLLSRHEDLLKTKQTAADKKRCKSVENVQLLTKDLSPENLSAPASKFVAPPSLHLKTGVFKHLYEWLRAKFPTLALKWTTHVFANERPYHGGTFVGNDVDSLLESVDFLGAEASKIEDGLAALPYVQAFRDFKKVKQACFGRTLNTDYPKVFEKFRQSMWALPEGSSHSSTKIHYLSWHLPDWIKDNGKGKGLSDVSEETPESLHAAFAKKLEQFKCYLGTTERDAQNLLRVTVAFNSVNI